VEEHRTIKKYILLFFSAGTDLLDLPEIKHAEETPFKFFNQPRKKRYRQASLPYYKHFLPLSSLNFAPQIAQMKGTILSGLKVILCRALKRYLMKEQVTRPLHDLGAPIKY
jgi:hypothetical protein